MSANYNRVILMGHLGQDPEMRYTPSGTAVANMNLATNRAWKNSRGEKQESVQWHRLVAWRKLAEICGQYLKKGSLIHVEGELVTRKYIDKANNNRYITEIVIHHLQMIKTTNGDSKSDTPTVYTDKLTKEEVTIDQDDEGPIDVESATI